MCGKTPPPCVLFQRGIGCRHEPDVNVSVFATELGDAVFSQGCDVLEGERFAAEVGDFEIGPVLLNGETNPVQEVGFSKPCPAVHKEGIVGSARNV